MLKKVSSKAAGEIATGGVHYTRPPQARQGALPPKGYVEDAFESRTKLGLRRVHGVKRRSWLAQVGGWDYNAWGWVGEMEPFSASC